MYRLAIEELYEWKKSANRKPLIIEGARQVGKTWLMKEFGKQAYDKTVYINFDSNSRMAELFSSDLEIGRIKMCIRDSEKRSRHRGRRFGRVRRTLQE